MRRHAPATARNREPILEILARVVPNGAKVLEIAAGTGEHALFFSQGLDAEWLPTDPDPDAVASIEAWRSDGGPNLHPARQMSVFDADWPAPVDAVVCINMIHISPWEATEALFAGAARALRPGGTLVTYGPYRIDCAHTAESNVAFEAWLHSLDPRYGVRDIAEVAAVAERNGIALHERIEMPANNFTLVWRR
ncbi:MAG: DUF938 domain-containing protein [Alphaproteobacteria bacterium]|nr:DUF938 domain-containing protein [Alphaproteobacteria bacterium]